jgi:hypothetical protein
MEQGVINRAGSGPLQILVHYDDGKEGAHGTSWFYGPTNTAEEFVEKHGIGDYYLFPNLPTPEKWIQWEKHLPIDPYEDIKLYKISECKTCLELCTEKCKKHFADQLRAERNNQLQKLDGEYMKCLETGADPSDVLARKKVLRDMPVSPVWDCCCTKEDFQKVTIHDIINHDPSTTSQ